MKKVNLNNKEELYKFLEQLDNLDTFEDIAHEVFDMADDPRGPQYAEDMAKIALYMQLIEEDDRGMKITEIRKERVKKLKEKLPADLRYEN